MSTNDLGADIVDPTQPWMPFQIEQPQVPNNAIPDEGFFLDDSLFNLDDTLTPNFGPLEWYDLLAEDAINSMQGQTQSSRWNFDITSLSRRQSPRQSVVPGEGGVTLGDADAPTVPLQDIIVKPWNTEYRIELQSEELVYFEHFITDVAPILDLFDPGKHFASVVPHLALRNVGLLKSILAVGACHMAICQPQQNNESISPLPLGTPGSTMSAPATTSKIAEQYYYETLQYISQNLLYQAYTTSNEILATAIMISTYVLAAAISSRTRLTLYADMKCTALLAVLITVTGIAIYAGHFGYNAQWIATESHQMAYREQSGGRGYVKTSGQRSGQVVPH